MQSLWQTFKWLFDGVGALIAVTVGGWSLKRIFHTSSSDPTSHSAGVGSEVESSEIGEIGFKFLPASLLEHGWKAADSSVTPSLRCSIPTDNPDGLVRIAESEDAIDYKLEKHQRVANRLRFTAKLSDGAHVYARIGLVSKDSHSFSKLGWIACDIGDKPPKKLPFDEWVVFRMPQKDGWTLFDLFLPEEVRRTFGQEEGLEFNEVLSIRLRGSLSVSSIKLYREIRRERVNSSQHRVAGGSKAKVSTIFGIVLALIPWGLQLIGVSVNVWLGFLILAVAFYLIAYAFWIWSREIGWNAFLRVAVIAVAAFLYFLLPVRKIIEWRSAQAQTSSDTATPAKGTFVAGVVVDQITNEAVGQARITIVGRTEEYVTDDSGNFRIALHGIVPRVVRLHITKVGFQPADTEIEPPQQNLVMQLRKQ